MTRRRLIGVVIVGIIRVVVATGATAQEASARPAVALADVAIAPGGWTLPPPQLSGTIIDLMMNELAASQRFHLFDGQWLIPESQTGGHADLEQLRAAAAERRVDYLVLGSLTAFSTENKKKAFGGVIPTPLLVGNVTKQQTRLHVELTFRIVDVRTGEIVATGSGDGIGVRRATGIVAGGIVGRTVPLPVGALVAAKLPAARDAMLDEALRQAVRNAALSLVKQQLPVTEHQSSSAR
jgi:curli biogenesis system outer membrane secretion channel CsgG